MGSEGRCRGFTTLTSEPQTTARLIYAGEINTENLTAPVLALLDADKEFISQGARAHLSQIPETTSADSLEALSWLPVRAVAEPAFDEHEGNQLERQWAAVLAAAVALSNWHRRYGFDPATGQPTMVVHSGWARRTLEGRELFPRTDPAVITAVTATIEGEEKILLGNAVAWEPGRFSTFAGFVEVGESLENTVERELFEEAGIKAESMKYMGSQPWPFPRSLMLGYRAVASNPQDACADGEEIREVRWFTRAELVTAERSQEITLPGRSSISRKLIEGWLHEEQASAHV